MGFTFLVINPELPVLPPPVLWEHPPKRHQASSWATPNLMSPFKVGNSKHPLAYIATDLIFLPCNTPFPLWPQALLKGYKHLLGELVTTATMHGASIMNQEPGELVVTATMLGASIMDQESRWHHLIQLRKMLQISAALLCWWEIWALRISILLEAGQPGRDRGRPWNPDLSISKAEALQRTYYCLDW